MAGRVTDSQQNDNFGFLVGLLAGTALGAGLALLFAPKTGVELRGDLRKTAEKATDALRNAGSTALNEEANKV